MHGAGTDGQNGQIGHIWVFLAPDGYMAGYPRYGYPACTYRVQPVLDGTCRHRRQCGIRGLAGNSGQARLGYHGLTDRTPLGFTDGHHFTVFNG